MMHVALASQLAVADLRHAKVATVCQVLGLTALLVPLLILLGIKNGYIADRTQAILENPENLRIGFVGQPAFTPDLVTRLSRNPDVRFVGPQPHTLAVRADFAEINDGGDFVPKVTLLATGRGDPYLPADIAVPEPGEVILTAALAGALSGVAIGDRIEALLQPRSNAPEGAYMKLTVVDVLPAAVWGRAGALMSRRDVFLLHDWTLGNARSTNLDVLRATHAEPGSYPLLRLYAKDVDAISSLTETLARDGFATTAQSEGTRSLLALRDALNIGFLTVALVGMVGMAVTFASSLWAGIDRNRRPISLLRAGGLGNFETMLIPITQALVIGVSGWLISLAIYAGLTSVLDLALATTFQVDGQLARLNAAELLASAVFTLTISAVAACAAAVGIISITPEEGFLDVR